MAYNKGVDSASLITYLVCLMLNIIRWLSNKSNKVDCSVMSDEGNKVTLLVFEDAWQLR